MSTQNIALGCSDCKAAPIPGFSNYAADEAGNIWLVRSVNNFVKNRLPYRLRPTLYPKGYWLVACTDDNGQPRKRLINRLVALAFLGPPPNPKYHAAHLDGNRNNNARSNIAWKTASQNALDKNLHGTMRFPVLQGEEHGANKLTTKEVLTIKELIRLKVRGQRIADIFEVSFSLISRIKRDITWKHLA